MERYFIGEENWQRLLKRLAGSARLVFPTAGEGEDYHFAVSGEADSPAVPFNPYRCVQSLKALLFEARRFVGCYFGEAPRVEGARGGEKIVVGAKACDLQSLTVLDFVFRGGAMEDPFYRENREKTLIVSSDCTEYKDVCFCTLVGGRPYPEGGYDLNLAPVEGGYLVEVGTARGQALIERNGDVFSAAGGDRTKSVAESRGKMLSRLEEHQRELGYLWGERTRELMERTYESPVWREEAERCVECGACNFVCPTCHCFLLSDEGRETFRRLRTWDSCQYKGFSRVGGGANPRPELYQRLRNRYEKKFDFCPAVMEVNGCTGCGRCVEACIGKIDMREVLKKLSGMK